MSIIRNLTPEEKKSHFRNVAVIAYKDGDIGSTEKQLLEIIAREWELTPEEMAAVETAPDSIEFKPPEDVNMRFYELYDLVHIAIIDGKLKACEQEVCIPLAEALGFNQNAVRTIIDGILEGNRVLRDPEEIRESLREKILSPA